MILSVKIGWISCVVTCDGTASSAMASHLQTYETFYPIRWHLLASHRLVI